MVAKLRIPREIEGVICWKNRVWYTTCIISNNVYPRSISRELKSMENLENAGELFAFSSEQLEVIKEANAVSEEYLESLEKESEILGQMKSVSDQNEKLDLLLKYKRQREMIKEIDE